MVHRIVNALLPLCLVVAALAPALAGAQHVIDQRRPAAPDGLLRVHNLVGAVRLIGWDRDTIAVSGTVGTGMFYFGVGKGSGKMGVELPPSAMELAAAAKTPVTGSVLEVRVPRRTRVWVKTASADIQVEEVTGGLDLYSVGGRITVRGSPQDLTAESMDGDLDVQVSTSSARVRSAGGAITLRGTIENALASSVSGTITVHDARLQRARFESISGGIRYEGNVERGSSLAFENHSGPVTIVVPAAVSADFDATAFNGEIRNTVARVTPRLGGDLRSKLLLFTVGDGGAQVTVRSFKGSVELLRK